MEIPVHKKRFVLLAAFDAYKKTLARAKKGNEDAHCSNTDVDEKLGILEHLESEYQNADGQLTLDGTPLGGEAMTAAHYKDDDGTDLSADALDDWMRRAAGCYVPIAVVAEWVLERRKLVSAWLRGIEKNVAETRAAWLADPAVERDANGDELAPAKLREITDDAQRVGRTCAPDFIDVAWFTPPVPVPAPKMTDAEVDEWVEKGPWGVLDYALSDEHEGEPVPPLPGTDWELVKRDGTDAAEIVDRSSFVYTGEGALADARHEAAVRNRNLAEAEPVVALETAAAAGEVNPIAELHPE